MTTPYWPPSHNGASQPAYEAPPSYNGPSQAAHGAPQSSSTAHGYAPPQPQYQPRDTVVLRVGNEQFTVRRSTLEYESGFFEKKFASEWSEADGSYYVDLDPAIFRHILDYIRMASYPLYLDARGNLDLVAYNRILVMAVYDELFGLADWLKERKYWGVLRFTYEQSWWKHVRGELETMSSDVVFETVDRNEQVWICPHQMVTDRPEEWSTDCSVRGASVHRSHWRDWFVTGTLVREKFVTIDHAALRRPPEVDSD